MYLCICKKISDKDIILSIKEGSHTIEDLRKKLKIGTQCGKCIKPINTLLKSQIENQKKT